LFAMSLVTLNGVSLRTGGKWLLWDIGLSIEPGDLLALFGRCGAGKSTLAKVLAGYLKPTRGSIDWSLSENSDIGRSSRLSQKQQRVGFGFQNPAFAPELTIYENLCFFASLSGLRGHVRSKRVAYLLELVGLASRRNDKPLDLSAGELKRAEIARLFLSESQVTIIDALLDSLERPVLEKVWEHILAQRRDVGRTFVVSTACSHVATLCPRIAVMHRGRIAFVGRPEDFRKLGGEDMLVLTELCSPDLRARIAERLSVVIKEEEGFLSFRVANGEQAISSLLAEFGSEIGCVYLRRPTLDDALDVLERGPDNVVTHITEGI